MSATKAKPAVGSREYVLTKLAEKGVTDDHQFWRANFNGSGVEYACPGPNHAPDVRNYLKLVAVEDALESAYEGGADSVELAALEKEHATLLAPILLQARRSEHAGTLGRDRLKSLLAKAADQAVQEGCLNVEQALAWLKKDGGDYCYFEDGQYIFSYGGEEKRPALKSIKQAIRRALQKDAKKS
jgi:hypothetical protein